MAAAETQEKTYGVTPLDVVKEMSGLEFLTAIRDGRLPAAPISRALDFELTEVEQGRVVFRGRPNAAHYNPLGSVHGGWFATLLDSCMACAIQTTLPKGTGYTTLEFKVNTIRAITEETGPVEAVGTLVQAGRRIGVSEGRLIDGAGKVLAHGSTTCLIFPL